MMEEALHYLVLVKGDECIRKLIELGPSNTHPLRSVIGDGIGFGDFMVSYSWNCESPGYIDVFLFDPENLKCLYAFRSAS